MSVLPPDEMLALLLSNVRSLERKLKRVVEQIERVQREIEQDKREREAEWDDNAGYGGTD